MSKIIRSFIALSLCVLSSFIGVSCAEEKQVATSYAKQPTKYYQTATAGEYVPTTIAHEEFSTLVRECKDTVGYLKVPGTTIDDIVVQADDNNYYLRRDPYGSYRHSGTYFADYRCDMVNLSQVTTIYGHNLANVNTYFGQLTRYKKLDFYKENPVFYYDTMTKSCEWKIFSVFIVKLDSNDFSYRIPDYENQQDFLNLIDECRNRSLIDTTVDVSENDKILNLYTCYYNHGNTGYRLVVMGRLLRDGEDPYVDVDGAKYNSDVLYPLD